MKVEGHKNAEAAPPDAPADARTPQDEPHQSRRDLRDLPRDLAREMTAGLDAQDIEHLFETSRALREIARAPHVRAEALAVSALAPPTMKPASNAQARLYASRQLVPMPAAEATGPLARVALSGSDKAAQVATYGLVLHAARRANTPAVRAQAAASLRDVALQAASPEARLVAARALTIGEHADANAALPALVTIACGEFDGHVADDPHELQVLLGNGKRGPDPATVDRLAASAGIPRHNEDSRPSFAVPGLADAALEMLGTLVEEPAWRPRALDALAKVARAAVDLTIRSRTGMFLEDQGDGESAACAFAAVAMAAREQLSGFHGREVREAIARLAGLVANGTHGARELLATVLADAPTKDARLAAAMELSLDPDTAMVAELHAAALSGPDLEAPSVAEGATNALIACALANGAAADQARESLVELARTAPEPVARFAAIRVARHQPGVAWPVPDAVVALSSSAHDGGAAAALHAGLLCDPQGVAAASSVARASADAAPLVRGAAHPLACAVAIAGMADMARGFVPLDATAVQALLWRAAGPAHAPLALAARALRCLLRSPWADDVTREAGTAALAAALRGSESPAALFSYVRDELMNFLDFSDNWAAPRGHNLVGMATAVAQSDAALDYDRGKAVEVLQHFARGEPTAGSAAAAAVAALRTRAR